MIGTLLSLAIGAYDADIAHHVVAPAALSPGARQDQPRLEDLPRVSFLAMEHTQAWFRSLWACGGESKKEGAGRGEL